jgi:hypothetical protein
MAAIHKPWGPFSFSKLDCGQRIACNFLRPICENGEAACSPRSCHFPYSAARVSVLVCTARPGKLPPWLGAREGNAHGSRAASFRGMKSHRATGRASERSGREELGVKGRQRLGGRNRSPVCYLPAVASVRTDSSNCSNNGASHTGSMRNSHSAILSSVIVRTWQMSSRCSHPPVSCRG